MIMATDVACRTQFPFVDRGSFAPDVLARPFFFPVNGLSFYILCSSGELHGKQIALGRFIGMSSGEAISAFFLTHTLR